MPYTAVNKGEQGSSGAEFRANLYIILQSYEGVNVGTGTALSTRG